MRTLIAVVVPVILAMLLILPGFCSEWWPVWLQAASLVIGLFGLTMAVAKLVWDGWKSGRRLG